MNLVPIIPFPRQHLHLFTRAWQIFASRRAYLKTDPERVVQRRVVSETFAMLVERRRGWKKMVDEECRIEILSRFARFDSKQSLYIPNQWIREILGNDWKKFTRENIRWNSLNSSCSKNKRSYCTNNNIYNRSKGSLQELRVSYNNLLGKLRLQFLQFLFKFIL